MNTGRTLSRIAILLSALAVAAVIVAAPVRAEAQSSRHPFGLGLRLGYPTAALTGKFWLDSRNALQIDVPLGNTYGRVDVAVGSGLAVDWVFRFAGRRGGSVGFGFHAGVGGEFWFRGCYNDPSGYSHCGGNAAVRFPLAVNLYFPRPSLELLFELFPRLFFDNALRLGYGGSIGLRYYF